jgi:hypothetical protein
MENDTLHRLLQMVCVSFEWNRHICQGEKYTVSSLTKYEMMPTLVRNIFFCFKPIKSSVYRYARLLL